MFTPLPQRAFAPATTIELTPGFDRPDTLSDLIVWLAETGFEVSVGWTHQDLAVLVARIAA